MSIFIRIYYDGKSKDISLEGIQKLSLGSGAHDDLKMPQTDLLQGHIQIINVNGIYTMMCKGPVLFHERVVQNMNLEPAQIFILSKKHRISMLVIEEYSVPGTELEIQENAVLSIGRDPSNSIVLDAPIVSRFHADIERKSSAYYIHDKRSTNGTYVNSEITKDYMIHNGDVIVIGACKIICENDKLYFLGELGKNGRSNSHSVGVSGDKAETNANGQIMFKRSPRLKHELPSGIVEIQPPPSIGEKPEFDKLGMILPLVTTLGIAVVMTAISGSPMMLLFTAPMHVISGIMSIRSYSKQSKKFKSQEKLRINKYNEHLDEAIKEIEKKRARQIVALTSADPTTGDCIDIVRNVERSLWDRRPTDSDFMSVRVGSGTQECAVKIRIPERGISLQEDNLTKKAGEIYKKYRSIDNMPVTFSILKWSTCGIVGNRSQSMGLVNSIVTQITTHHCYNEVKLVIVFDESDSAEMRWMKNLPHTYDDDRETCYVAKNKKEASVLFDRIEEELKERYKENGDDYDKATLNIPYYLFIVSSPELLEGETIRKYLYRNDPKLGLGSILLFDELEALPKECNVIIESKQGKGLIYSKDNVSNKQAFIFDRVDERQLDAFANKMKTIFCNDITAGAEITDKITLYEVFGVASAKELDLENRWKNSNAIKTLAAPIGVKEKNALVYLDLHEDAHGSHGLVAGTTGSGKSETLQTYVLSVATLYHPYEVGFVIIDFKGGGMANQFENLPHLIGAITDMDGREVNRSLLSIKAELDKRKRLFAESGVNKIDQYIEMFRNGQVKTPIPHLVIIVDEFAELKADQPEFMQELVSAARIGRSLGVHLILATQKPAGQVSDQIWSNSNFKLCLKVRDESDSKEVLKSPLAAKIKKTGRGYLKVGNDDIFDLFQSGYSGAKVEKEDGTTSTQLKEIITHINDYCQSKGIKKLRPICLPSLPAKIPYAPNFVMKNIKEANIPIGIFDNPSQQEQGISYIDVNQNTFIIGSAQTGKTNVIQSVIRSLSSNYAPNELNIYIMDFASMTLKIFEKLNHVGGVVLPDEEEKIKNLFKLLEGEIENRKKKTTQAGVSSFAAYLEGGYKDMPRILLVLDNYSVYKELYGDEYETVFLRLCREGVTYGITVIVTNTTTSGFGYKYLSLFADRIAFTCNDTGEYSNVFDRCRIEPTNCAGRALCSRDGELLETQMFMAFGGDKEIERSANARKYIEETNNMYQGLVAKPIPYIPEVLTKKYILENYNTKPEAYEYIMGLDYASVDVVSLQLDKMSELSIVGKEQDDRAAIAHTLIKQIADGILDNPVEMTIIDSIERPLKKYSEMPFVSQYSIDYSEIGTVIDDLCGEVEDRYDVLVNESLEALSSYPLIVVVVNSRESMEYLSTTKDVCEQYKQIMKKAKALKILFVFSNIENASVSFGAPEILKRQKDVKNAFLTDNLRDVQFYDIASNITRNSKDLQQGDAFYLKDSTVQRMKLIEE